jgi:ATP-dependent 26S proteasome regulatory subunit
MSYQNTKKALAIRATERVTYKEALLRVKNENIKSTETRPKISETMQTNQSQALNNKQNEDRMAIIEQQMAAMLETIKQQSLLIQELKDDQDNIKSYTDQELDKIESSISTKLTSNQETIEKAIAEQNKTFIKNFNQIQSQINQIVLNQNNFIAQIKELIKPPTPPQPKPTTNQKPQTQTTHPTRK